MLRFRFPHDRGKVPASQMHGRHLPGGCLLHLSKGIMLSLSFLMLTEADGLLTYLSIDYSEDTEY